MTSPTTATLSHNLIAALDPRRDALYAAALTITPPDTNLTPAGKIETVLHALIREAFAALEKDSALEPWATVEAAIRERNPTPLSPAADRPAASMPADLWARLVATIQVEAARSAHTRAINPDSVLLSPDPLLAPRKMLNPDDADGFDLSPSSRFLVAAAVAVVVGIILTIYLLTRPAPTTPDGPAPRPPAASAP